MAITVDPLNCPTDINTTFIPYAWAGLPYYYQLQVTGGVGPFIWTATGLPQGLSININTGEITGVPGPDPSVNGWHTVTVTVRDSSQPWPCCCKPLRRSFKMFVDCWANHPGVGNMVTSYFGCNTCSCCNTCTNPCDCRVEIGLGLESGQTKVLVDNIYEATLAGGETRSIASKPCKGRVVSVDQTVPGPDDKTRYEVIGTNHKPCTDINNVAYFNYRKVVRIDTGSDPPGIAVPGAGWYALGIDFSTTVPATIDSDGARYIFKEFSLPDSTTSPNRNLVFTVNKAGSVIAKYDKLLPLTLKSDFPLVNETLWKPEGTVTWNLALQPVPTGNFWGLIGARWKAVNARGSTELHEAKTVEILWKKDCTIPWIIMLLLLMVVAGLVYYYGFYRRRKLARAEAVQAERKRRITKKGATSKTIRRRTR